MWIILEGVAQRKDFNGWSQFNSSEKSGHFGLAFIICRKEQHFNSRDVRSWPTPGANSSSHCTRTTRRATGVAVTSQCSAEHTYLPYQFVRKDKAVKRERGVVRCECEKQTYLACVWYQSRDSYLESYNLKVKRL